MKRNLTVLAVLFGIHIGHSQQFEKISNVISQDAFGSRSAAFIDVNGDDLLDVYITNGPSGGQINNLYVNMGNGEFDKNATSQITLDVAPSDGATWGDINNDGHVDLYVANWYGERNQFYLNRGNFEFDLVQEGGIIQNGHSETASWGDYDQDGYLDLYVTNSPGAGAKNFFLKNLGDDSFSQLAETPNAPNDHSRSVNWTDFDGDGDLDLFVGNENASFNFLYVNNDGVFEASEDENLAERTSTTGSSWADIDNDGDLDLLIAIFGGSNILYRNDGDSFTKLEDTGIEESAGFSFGTVWGDVDNDGDLDLFVANGSFADGTRDLNYLYLNQGNNTFIAVTDDYMTSEDGWSFGAAFGDYDRDGFLDLVVARTYGQAQQNLLYHNLGNDNNWVNIKCTGSISNRSAIGTKVKAKATIGGEEVWQLREISAQSGYNCQNSLNVHFGFGDATIIDELIIEWPLGTVQTFQDVAINSFHSYTEPVPASFVRSNFSAETKEVDAGEEVSFTNLSVYDTDQETSFSWDLDGDGTEDSQAENPTFAYDEDGTYNVSLTVSNASASDVRVREAYIQVGNVTGIGDANENLVLFPNPITDTLRLKGERSIVSITVRDLNGKVVLERRNEERKKEMQVGVASLVEGTYLIEVVLVDETKLIRRFVKMKE